MKRRAFVATSLAAGLGTLGAAASGESGGPPAKEFYELREYKMASAAKAEAMEAFYRDVGVPAWNRVGIRPVGVFRMMEGDDPTLFVLLPHPTVESVVTATDRVMADPEYLKAGEAVLDAPITDPAYLRRESSLLVAFDAMPKLEVPTTKPTRVLQLRTYESHSVLKGRKKVEMFNKGGEIAIFRRVGMNPVFFGEALIGSKLPCLTYMLGFDDKEAQDKAWAAFRDDPAWLELKAKEEYKDTVSNITNLVLRPSPASQI